MLLSSNVRKVTPSMTLLISARAKAMKAEGIDVISMSAGEPDFATPIHIRDAAINAINEGFTYYTPASGIIELKRAVCEKFKRDNCLDYDVSQIMINCGAKHSIFLAIFALIEPGDEVIIPSPYWVSYPEMVKLAGGIPVILESREGRNMKVSAQQLNDAITTRTKLFILNTPSNPTGMVYTESELRALAEVIGESKIYVISDEIYEKFVYNDTKHVSIASLSEHMYKITITVNGVSKTYSIPGWRIGYAAGPEEIINGMATVQSHETSNPCSISQKAALAALNGPHDFLGHIINTYDKRRQYIIERFNTIEGVSCIEPKGAFYVFTNVSAVYGKSFKGVEINGSVAFCEYMLNKQNIAMVPGSAFGSDAHVRISYATSMENIEKALDRFENGLKTLI